jgi:hypothetical protein
MCRYSWTPLLTCPSDLSLSLMQIFLVKCETSSFETAPQVLVYQDFQIIRCQIKGIWQYCQKTKLKHCGCRSIPLDVILTHSSPVWHVLTSVTGLFHICIMIQPDICTLQFGWLVPCLHFMFIRQFWKGHAVVQSVEALHYKLEGHRFNSQWCPWNFSLI